MKPGVAKSFLFQSETKWNHFVRAKPQFHGDFGDFIGRKSQKFPARALRALAEDLELPFGPGAAKKQCFCAKKSKKSPFSVGSGFVLWIISLGGWSETRVKRHPESCRHKSETRTNRSETWIQSLGNNHGSVATSKLMVTPRVLSPTTSVPVGAWSWLVQQHTRKNLSQNSLVWQMNWL